MLAARAVVELAAALDEELEAAPRARPARRRRTAAAVRPRRPRAAGIAVDVAYLQSLEQGFAERVRAAADAAYDVIGEQVNLGSPKRLR